MTEHWLKFQNSLVKHSRVIVRKRLKYNQIGQFWAPPVGAGRQIQNDLFWSFSKNVENDIKCKENMKQFCLTKTPPTPACFFILTKNNRVPPRDMTEHSLTFLNGLSSHSPPKGAKVYPASRRRFNKRVGLKGQLAPHCVP